MTDLFGLPLVNAQPGPTKPVKGKEQAAAAIPDITPDIIPDTPTRPYTVVRVSKDETWIFNQ